MSLRTCKSLLQIILRLLPYRMPLLLAVPMMPCIVASSCHLLMPLVALVLGFEVTGKGAGWGFVSWSAETEMRHLVWNMCKTNSNCPSSLAVGRLGCASNAPRMCPSRYCLGLEQDAYVCKTPLTVFVVFGVSLPALSPDQQRQM